MRLFFAVELPAEIQAALGKLKVGGEESRDYRWVDPSLLHVTLAFLGQQPAERLEVLQQVGTQAASESRQATLRLGEPGSFGPRKAPRVLWVGLEGDLQALDKLQASLDASLRQAGFQLEDRPFRPHITLARRREAARGGPPPGWLPERGLSRAPFDMRKLTLFESRLSPRGATYAPIFEFPLATR